MGKSYFSKEFVERYENDIKNGTRPNKAFKNSDIIRPFPSGHDPMLLDEFQIDVQKVIYCPYYNRYSGKTQVFGLYKNDDITRRDIHVQRVAQCAKIIGRRLNLNEDLIEAIAYAHDLGHTPFGHTGEKYLHKLYNEQTHRNFNHNIQSVRILTDLFPNNVSLQVLDGVAGHNGEEPEEELVPAIRTDYNKFIEEIEECYTDPENKKARRFRASTLEGLVVRYADVIAYIISDRLDYMKIKGPQMFVTANRKVNSAAMSRYEVDIIENSYDKNSISMSKETIKSLMQEMEYNYEFIYHSYEANGRLMRSQDMMAKLYETFLKDIETNNRKSPIFTQHIEKIENYQNEKKTILKPYIETEPNQIVVDFIASMTDEYFRDIYEYMFGMSFTSYFDD